MGRQRIEGRRCRIIGTNREPNDTFHARRQQQPKGRLNALDAVSRHARLQVCRRKFKRLPLPRTHACRGIPEIRAALSPHGLASHCTAKVPSGVLRPLFCLAHAREVREVGVGEDNRGASRISKWRRTDRPIESENSVYFDFDLSVLRRSLPRAF